jgi:excisionase family DNA binding protein
METYLTPADAARLLGVTPATVREMERRGVLKTAARTKGGARLFRREDVQRLVRERQRGRQT